MTEQEMRDSLDALEAVKRIIITGPDPEKMGGILINRLNDVGRRISEDLRMTGKYHTPNIIDLRAGAFMPGRDGR